MKQLLFFSSPIGLGHVTRDIAISQNFENLRTKFVSGNGAVKLLQENEFEVDDAYNPPQFFYKEGILHSQAKWLWNYYKYYKKCKKISSEIIKKEEPNIVVSDEDFASLTVSQEQNIPSILITDILETRFTKGFTSIIEKRMNKSMKEIMKKCNFVIIPEDGKDTENFRYVGPIVRTTKKSREELRKQFSFNKKIIVVSVGGTPAGKFLIEKTIDIFDKLPNDLELVIVSGPSLQKEFQANVKNLGFVNNLHEVIYAADLVISLAGKSTIDESKAYGTPGIFIPIKDHFEQEDNAKEVGFSFDDVNRLESLISEKLAEDRNPVNCDGAKKASEIILNVLNESK